MIQELIFQGVFHTRTPVRLEFTEPYVQLKIPSSIDPEQIKLVLTTMLYPEHLSDEERQEVAFGQDIKIAVVFDALQRSWRILRREDDDSLRLQVRENTGYRDIASGAEVSKLLQDKLKFPPFGVFSALNLWRFDRELPSAPGKQSSLKQLDDRTRTIILKYKEALEFEALEDQVRSIEQLHESTRQRLGEGAKLEDNIDKAQRKLKEIEIESLSEEDLRLLDERDARLASFHQQIVRLEGEEENAREEVNAWLPNKPWKNQFFWLGLVISVASLAVSIAMQDTARPVAAANVFGLGMSAWVMLRYFTDMERASVHVVRLDSIKRRLTQVREEQVAFRERIGHLLIHAGVENEAELLERFEKSSKLREIVSKMEEQLARHHARPAYQQAKREIAELEETLRELQAQRAAKGIVNFSSYQLERDLINLGFDPDEVLHLLATSPSEQSLPEYERDNFSRLAEIARRVGLMSDAGRLAKPVLSMWGKICGHVMGARFKEIEMDGQGNLRIGGLEGEQLQMWARTRPRELATVSMGLAMALLLNLPSRYEGLNTVLLPVLTEQLSSDHASRMEEVLKSAARKMRVIICH